jgi:Zn-dependent protease with chaperone function
MDFFAAQDKARSKTKLLVALFVLAVSLIVVVLYALFAFIFLEVPDSAPISDYWHRELFIWVSLITLAIIGGASGFKVLSLRSGGAAVAKSLGAREVPLDTRDPQERQLLNVVEEMAIASGVPMPPVFILEESSINAFAAGFSVHDAAVAVTRGALEKLSRDEMQGVMAHEFSHILNGDMRLNIRLMGPLFGLLVIAFIGRGMIRSSFYRGSSRDSKGSGAAFVLLGLAVMLIGYIGVLFGRLIQAAISRQREFLADSAAVQFTRNPEGIAGALKKIGFKGGGSAIEHPHAEDTAHLFFAKALKGGFATHPPLPTRIRAIDPQWDGQFLPPRGKSADTKRKSAPNSDKIGTSATPPPLPIAVTSAAAIAITGCLTERNIRRAVRERIAIHEALGRFLEQPETARHLLYALLLDDKPERRDEQLAFIPQLKAELDVAMIAEAAGTIAGWPPTRRFETLILLAPAMKKLSAKRLRQVPHNLRRLAESNGVLSLRELLVIRVVKNEIDGHAKPTAHNRLSDAVDRFADAMAVVLSFFAFLDTTEAGQVAADVTKSVSQQPRLKGKIEALRECPSTQALDGALEEMLDMSFDLRKALLSAAAEVVLSDGEVSAEEWCALRLTALALDCPMPELYE